MLKGDRDLDTICAVSTPPGRGGISIIRVSGKKAVSITREIAPFLPDSLESHRAYFGTLRSTHSLIPISRAPDTEAKNEIDEVVITYFAEGRSFTGEHTLEISFHGNPVIAGEILNHLIVSGARIADRGEFTYRSFMSGRIDLTQAESVLSLIESQSIQASKLALRQLKGSLSQQLEKIELDLTRLLAHMEASIDFSTEGLEIISPKELDEKIKSISSQIDSLLKSYKKGRALSAGFRVVFAGIPNVGKSSLLNNLLEESRAIVTDIPGTTRDLVEDQLMIDGALVRVTDTAGIRESLDVVEKLGVAKSRQAIEDADLIFYIYDLEQGLTLEDFTILATLPWERLVFLGNKLDRVPKKGDVELGKDLIAGLHSGKDFKKDTIDAFDFKNRVLFVSALDKSTCFEMKRKIGEILKPGEMDETAVISQTRHFEGLNLASEGLARAQILADKKMSPEFLALELKEALVRVQEILGKRFDDEIMDRVFKEFCLGK